VPNDLKFLSKLNDAFNLIAEGIVEMNNLLLTCEDEELGDTLGDYVIKYATLNYELSAYLIKKLEATLQEDRDSDDFNTLMKDFE